MAWAHSAGSFFKGSPCIISTYNSLHYMKKKQITVALLSGGTSSEREISIRSGEEVYQALNRDRYAVLRYDPKTDIARLVQDAPAIDIALVILHGMPGEDGTIQGLLDLLGIPYQCSGTLGSSVAMNKLASKHLYEKAGIRTPAYAHIRRGEDFDADACIDRLGLPLVIKPASGGSSIGMTIAKSAGELMDAFAAAFAYDRSILAEEYIKGTEITCGVIGNRALQPLPVVEIVPRQNHEFFDFKAKYSGETDEICPARISPELTGRAGELAVAAHRALFCEGYSRTDMIIRDGDLYVLETNTIPGMTRQSLLPLSAKQAGMSFSELLDRLIDLGLERHQQPGKTRAKQ